MAAPNEPDQNCPDCPRLVEYRMATRDDHPDWHNAPVPSFGGLDARLLVVGLAPGLRGANRTGRPFTGDYAGDLLYPTLIKYGFAEGTFGAAADDGLGLVNCRITNAVRCVPPQNKVTGPETKACRPFLVNEIAGMANLKAVLALGTVAHGAVLSALGVRKANHPFGHGARHALADQPFELVNSYHCSRYNTNTKRLTEAMFHDVFQVLKDVCGD